MSVYERGGRCHTHLSPGAVARLYDQLRHPHCQCQVVKSRNPKENKQAKHDSFSLVGTEFH